MHIPNDYALTKLVDLTPDSIKKYRVNSPAIVGNHISNLNKSSHAKFLKPIFK